MQLRRLSRAEYLWQPAQLLRRTWRELTRVRSRPSVTIQLPWRFPIELDPRESIGRSIVALNALDLPVTETIWRLLDDGDACADVGANIGYMTSVMAARLKRGGQIAAFEPLPELAEILRRNVAAWASLTAASILVKEEALSDCNEPASFHVPGNFAENRGTASLAAPQSARGESSQGGRTLTVSCRRLDDWAPPTLRLGLMKVDVEGCELQVFRGAEALLTQRRIRDIVFEEHRAFPAESTTCLQVRGFRLFRVARGWFGPRLLPPESELSNEIDPPTYLATLEPDRAIARFAAHGWHCLKTG